MQQWRTHHGRIRRFGILPIVALAVLILPLAVGTADAGFLVLTGTGYELTTPTGVSAVYNNTPGTFPDTSAAYSGTLTIDASFATNSSLTLNFVQTSVVGGLAASGGLRIALDTLMLNSTTQSWVHFSYTLVDHTDLTNVNIGSTGAHLSVAHFHPQSDPGITGNTKYTTTGMSVLVGLDNKSLIELGSGPLPPGGEITLKDALLHERNYNDTDGNPVLRSFDLILTPTPAPAPASIILLASGGLVGAGFSWLRRRRQTEPPSPTV